MVDGIKEEVARFRSDPRTTSRFEDGKEILTQKGSFTNFVSDRLGGRKPVAPSSFNQRQFIISNGRVIKIVRDTRVTQQDRSIQTFTPFVSRRITFQNGQMTEDISRESQGVGRPLITEVQKPGGVFETTMRPEAPKEGGAIVGTTPTGEKIFRGARQFLDDRVVAKERGFRVEGLRDRVPTLEAAKAGERFFLTAGDKAIKRPLGEKAPPGAREITPRDFERIREEGLRFAQQEKKVERAVQFGEAVGASLFQQLGEAQLRREEKKRVEVERKRISERIGAVGLPAAVGEDILRATGRVERKEEVFKGLTPFGEITTTITKERRIPSILERRQEKMLAQAEFEQKLLAKDIPKPPPISKQLFLGALIKSKKDFEFKEPTVTIKGERFKDVVLPTSQAREVKKAVSFQKEFEVTPGFRKQRRAESELKRLEKLEDVGGITGRGAGFRRFQLGAQAEIESVLFDIKRAPLKKVAEVGGFLALEKAFAPAAAAVGGYSIFKGIKTLRAQDKGFLEIGGRLLSQALPFVAGGVAVRGGRFLPFKAETVKVKVGAKTFKIRTAGFELAGRGRGLAGVTFKVPKAIIERGTLKFREGFIDIGKPKARFKLEQLKEAVAVPRTAQATKAFRDLFGVTAPEKVRITAAQEVGRGVGKEIGAFTEDLVFDLKAFRKPRAASRLISKTIGRERGVFFGSVVTKQLGKQFRTFTRESDLDVFFPGKTETQLGIIAKNLARKLQRQGELVRISGRNKLIIETRGGTKITEFKAGIDPTKLSLGESPAGVGGLGFDFPDIKKGRVGATAPFGRRGAEAIGVGEQTIRKAVAASFFRGRDIAAPKGFQEPGILPRGRRFKDLPGFIQTTRGIIELRRQRGARFKGIETSIDKFVSTFTKEQQKLIEKAIKKTTKETFAFEPEAPKDFDFGLFKPTGFFAQKFKSLEDISKDIEKKIKQKDVVDPALIPKKFRLLGDISRKVEQVGSKIERDFILRKTDVALGKRAAIKEPKITFKEPSLSPGRFVRKVRTRAISDFSPSASSKISKGFSKSLSPSTKISKPPSSKLSQRLSKSLSLSSALSSAMSSRFSKSLSPSRFESKFDVSPSISPKISSKFSSGFSSTFKGKSDISSFFEFRGGGTTTEIITDVDPFFKPTKFKKKIKIPKREFKLTPTLFETELSGFTVKQLLKKARGRERELVGGLEIFRIAKVPTKKVEKFLGVSIPIIRRRRKKKRGKTKK